MAFLKVSVITLWEIRSHEFAQTERDVAKSHEDALEETGSAQTLWTQNSAPALDDRKSDSPTPLSAGKCPT